MLNPIPSQPLVYPRPDRQSYPPPELLQNGGAGEGLGDACSLFGGAGLVDAGIRRAETKGRAGETCPRAMLNFRHRGD